MFGRDEGFGISKSLYIKTPVTIEERPFTLFELRFKISTQL